VNFVDFAVVIIWSLTGFGLGLSIFFTNTFASASFNSATYSMGFPTHITAFSQHNYDIIAFNHYADLVYLNDVIQVNIYLAQ